MTTKTTLKTLFTGRKAALLGVGAAVLALPLLAPAAQADDHLRVNINLGAPAVAYRPAPVRVATVRPAPVVVQRVVYVQPRANPRMAWREHERHERWEHRREQAWNRGWHGERVAYRY